MRKEKKLTGNSNENRIKMRQRENPRSKLFLFPIKSFLILYARKPREKTRAERP